MSDQKINERKKTKKNEDKSNKSDSTESLSKEDEDFQTARESLSSDTDKIDEPHSSNYLIPAKKVSELTISSNDRDNKATQDFRSSISLHHLHTIKSVTQEISDEMFQTPSQVTLRDSPEISDINAAAASPASAAKQQSQTSTKSGMSVTGEQPKTVRISTINTLDGVPSRPRASLEAQKRHSQRGLKPEDSFRTNLGTGTAFVYMVLPPDGGYGWVITFVSFLVQVITDGIVYSIGIILPVMAKDLNVEITQATLISALQICFYYLSGPITSTIINKFSFRTVAIIGSAGSSVCLLISSFSPNLGMMLLFYAILGGPCLAMVWVSSQLIIGYYFEKYRSIANGISCSGSGAGLITFIELNTLLVPKIGWRNNMRVQAGLLIASMLLTLSYADVPPSKIGIIREQDPTVDLTDEDEEQEMGSFNYADPSSVEPEDRAVEFITLEKIRHKNLQRLEHKSTNRFQKWVNKHLCCNCGRKPEEVDDGTKRYVIKKDLIDRQDLYYTGRAEYTDHDRAAKREIIDGKDVELIEVDRPVQSINYSISQFATRKSKPVKKKQCCSQMGKTFRILFNFSLFHIMEFQVLFASAFLFALGYNIPFLFSKSRLKLPAEQVSYIPIFIGITNFLFRIICGFIAFKFKKSVIYLCGGAVVLGGLACFVSAFYGTDSFWFQIAYASVFGIAPAFFSTLRAIIYVQYLGLENLTNAFCMVSMGMGLAIFFGTMAGSLLSEITGGYVAPFVFAGLSIIIAGVLKLILPSLSHRRQTERKVKFQV